MIPKLCVIGVVLACTGPAMAVDGAPQPDDRIELACAGTMIAGGSEATESRIVADGLVDFLKKQVDGFGIGRAPIVFVSAAEVRFGSSVVDIPKGPRSIDGSIDRKTGDTRILVRSSQDPTRILIDMRLGCRMTMPVS